MIENVYLSDWRYRAVIISAALAAIGYLGFFVWGGWEDVTSAIVEVGLPGVAVAILLSFLNYSLRFARWQIYLRALGHNIPAPQSFKMYLAGFALTTTPGRAGEVLRGVLLKRWNVPYLQSIAAYFSERLSDLLAIAILTTLGLSIYPGAQVWILAGFGLVFIGLVMLSQARLIERCIGMVPTANSRLRGFLRHLNNILIEAQRCHKPSLFLTAALLGIVACSSEGFAFYCLLNWIGGPSTATLTFALFVYALSILAGALSFMPGGLGGTEVVMVTLLIWKGVPPAHASAAVLLIRLCTLWFSVTIGIFCLIRIRSSANYT